MLIMTFKRDKNTVTQPNLFFNHAWEEDWLTTDFARDAIMGIDKSKLISPNCIESPVLGQITPLMLSGGVKTVLLIKNMPEYVFNGSACGDNCAEWLLKACEGREQKVYFWHGMHFHGCKNIEIMFEDSGVVAQNEWEYMDELCRLVAEGRAY